MKKNCETDQKTRAPACRRCAPICKNSLARHRVRDWHCKGDGLEAVALTDAVLLTGHSTLKEF